MNYKESDMKKFKKGDKVVEIRVWDRMGAVDKDSQILTVRELIVESWGAKIATKGRK